MPPGLVRLYFERHQVQAKTLQVSPLKQMHQLPPFLLREIDLKQSIVRTGLGSTSSSHALLAMSHSMQVSSQYKQTPLLRGLRNHWQYLHATHFAQVSVAYFVSRSYSFSLNLHTSKTRLGVLVEFFLNTSKITIASASIRYIIRQMLSSSLIRNSWQRAPTLGIGLKCGRPIFSPFCNRLSRSPASNLASFVKGGVFTSPCSHTKGLSFGLMRLILCQI